MFDIAIICSSIEARKPLLERSLQTWIWDAAQSGLSVAIRVYTNGYTHDFGQRIMIRSSSVDVAYAHDPEMSGSHIAGYNFWWERTEAKVYLFTHPDLLFPKGTIRTAFERAKPNIFVAFKPFWLPEYVTKELHLYPWQTPELLEKYDEIYRLDPKQHGMFYWNTNTREITHYDSTTTYAMEAETLKKIFPFPDLSEQGYDDPYHQILRGDLGIQNDTVMEPCLFHQHHPQRWGGDCDRASLQATEILHLYRQTGGDPHETYRLAQSLRAKWGIPTLRS